MQTIGKKIRELRIKADMTQKSLAKALGISPSAVGMYEQDRREPDSHILGSLCRIFGVSGDYFIGEYDTAASDGMEVSAVFDEFTRRLAVQEGLMFDGVPLTQDDRRKIIDALKVVAAIAGPARGKTRRFDKGGGELD